MNPTPILSGVHHLKLPVADLEAGAAWCEKVLQAVRVARLDHFDEVGARSAAIMSVPGLEMPLQLLLVPDAVAPGYDPVTFGVANREELDRWASHLDACSVERSPVSSGLVGDTLTFQSPDGVVMRLYTVPGSGFGPEFFSATG